MLAETQDIVSELESLRSGKLRIAAIHRPLRLKVIALVQRQGLEKIAAACKICPSTIRKWPEFLEQKTNFVASQKFKRRVQIPNFTVTQITTEPIFPRYTPAIITAVRADGLTLQFPENSALAEKIVSLFLVNL